MARNERRSHFIGAMEGAWRVFGAGAYILLKIKYMRREKRKVESLQWGDGVAHGGVFAASTYSVLKIEHEWRETKGKLTSMGRWKLKARLEGGTHASGVGVHRTACHRHSTTIDE